jgi:hypothetical protein
MRFAYGPHPSRPLANCVALQRPSGTSWTSWEASDTVPRSSIKSSRSRFRQVASGEPAAAVLCSTKRLSPPVVRYPAGGAQGQVRDHVRDHDHDDVDVAVRSRVLPIRAHAHVHDRAQDVHGYPPIPAFHCVLVRHCWPSPVVRKGLSAVERTTRAQREERPTRASPKAVLELEETNFVSVCFSSFRFFFFGFRVA